MANLTTFLSDVTGGLKDILRDIAALMEARFDLMSLELQEEKERMVCLILWAAVAVVFFFLALVMVTFTILYFVPPRFMGTALIVFSLGYVLAALACLLIIKKKLGTRPFQRTLEEFQKDRDCLG